MQTRFRKTRPYRSREKLACLYRISGIDRHRCRDHGTMHAPIWPPSQAWAPPHARKAPRGTQLPPGKYPPAEPGALICEPLKAAIGGRSRGPGSWGHQTVAPQRHRFIGSRR